MKLSHCRSSAFILLAAGAFCGRCWAQTADQSQGAIERADNRCAAYGAGFVPVEGTHSCIRVGGHVRVEMGERPTGFQRPSPLDTPQADWTYSDFPPRVEGTIPAGLSFEGQTGD